MTIENQDVSRTTTTTTAPATDEEEEYEEEFEIEIRTQKGSSIKVESSSYNKLDDLLDKAFNTYKRLEKEESGEVDEKLQYQ
jgi:hypothetical protein